MTNRNQPEFPSIQAIRSITIATLAVPFLLALCGCATSLGDLPVRQQSILAHCPSGTTKVCMAESVSRFKKRYEYCACQRS